MTRDEILAVPVGRGMDALIHEYVFGGKVDTNSKSWRDSYGFENTNYSTNIADAWSVLEQMNRVHDEDNAKYYQRWVRLNDLMSDLGTLWVLPSWEAAEFICRAALIATLSETE